MSGPVGVRRHVRRRAKARGTVMIGGERSLSKGLGTEAYHQRLYSDDRFVAVLERFGNRKDPWQIRIFKDGIMVDSLDHISTQKNAERMADELVAQIQDELKRKNA